MDRGLGIGVDDSISNAGSRVLSTSWTEIWSLESGPNYGAGELSPLLLKLLKEMIC